jgi:hypothetical protein
MAEAVRAGDDVVRGANMIFDRSRVYFAAPEEIWPWLVQLGKRRAGWYLPARTERFVPRRRRAAWSVQCRWQTLRVGDRVPDYGGRDEYLEVVALDRPNEIVYRTERRGSVFSWTLSLCPLDGSRTVLRLRFRGRLRSTGWRRWALLQAGELLDRITSELMFTGLAERIRSTASAHLPLEPL